MEQAESDPDSLRVFTREKWFVQLGMAARGIACCSKLGTSGRIVMRVPAFKLPACPRVTGKPELGALANGNHGIPSRLPQSKWVGRGKPRWKWYDPDSAARLQPEGISHG